MTTGTIKSVLDRGFGFISPDGAADQDLFFHSSSVTTGDFEALREGMRVSFEQEPDPRDASRKRAVSVAPIDETDA